MATTALPILDDAVNSASITDLNRMKRDDLRKALDTGAVYVVHLDRKTRPVGVFLGIDLYRQLTRELLPRTGLHPVIQERKSYYVPKPKRPKDSSSLAPLRGEDISPGSAAEVDQLPEPIRLENFAQADDPPRPPLYESVAKEPEPAVETAPPVAEEVASAEDELEFWGDDVPWK